MKSLFDVDYILLRIVEVAPKGKKAAIAAGKNAKNTKYSLPTVSVCTFMCGYCLSCEILLFKVS